jgi:cysteine synthase
MPWNSNWALISWLPTPSATTSSTIRHITYGVILGVSLSVTSTTVLAYYRTRKNAQLRGENSFEPRPIELRSDDTVSGVAGLIGTFSNLRERPND